MRLSSAFNRSIGKSCVRGEVGDLDPVSLKSMVGLFVVTVGIALLSGVGAVMQRVCGAKEVHDSLDHTATEGELLRELLNKVCCADSWAGRLSHLFQVGHIELKLKGEESAQDQGSLQPNGIDSPVEFVHWIDGSLGALFDRCLTRPMLASG